MVVISGPASPTDATHEASPRAERGAAPDRAAVMPGRYRASPASAGGAPGGAALLRHWRAGTPRKRSRAGLASPPGGLESPPAPPGAPFPHSAGRKTGIRRARAAKNRAGEALAGRTSAGARRVSAAIRVRLRSRQPKGGRHDDHLVARVRAGTFSRPGIGRDHG